MKSLKDQSESIFGEALGYLKTLERSLARKSRFNNELLYQIAAITLEKLLVALLASYEINATHHTPLALIEEANSTTFVPEGTDAAIDGFGNIVIMLGGGFLD